MKIVCVCKGHAAGLTFGSMNNLGRFVFWCVACALASVLSFHGAKAQLLVSSFLPNAKGSDGNFEYIQLFAIEDINFTKTPFTVITCNNGNALKTNGWVSGLTCTYAMEINSGSIKRGETLYVGGVNCMLNGPNSEDISDLNWVKRFDCLSMLGDGGIGSRRAKNFGFLGNGGDADGIAVFGMRASEISASSVPIDAVFYGDTITRSATYRYIMPDGSVFNENSEIFRISSDKDNLLYKVSGWYNHLSKLWVKGRDVVHTPLLSRDSLAPAILFVPLVYDIASVYENCKLAVSWDAFPSADSFAIFIAKESEPMFFPKNGVQYKPTKIKNSDSIEKNGWTCVYSGSEKHCEIEDVPAGDYQLSIFSVSENCNYSTELYLAEYQTTKFTIEKAPLPKVITDSTIIISSSETDLNAADFISANSSALSFHLEDSIFNCPKLDSIYKTKLVTSSKCGEKEKFDLSLNFKLNNVQPAFIHCPNDTSVYIECRTDSFYFTPQLPEFAELCNYYTISSEHLKAAHFKEGKHKLTFYLTDFYGTKTDSCSYYLNIIHKTEPPKIICPKDTTIYITNGACEAYFRPQPPIAANGTFMHIPPSSATLSDGEKATFLFVAEDKCGEKRDTCAITATAKDTAEVNFVNCPTDKKIELADNQQDTTLTMEEVQISKDCGSYTVTAEPTAENQTFEPGCYNFAYHIKNNDDEIIKSCQFSISITKRDAPPSYHFDDTYQKKIITPNADGANDRFEITDIEQFPENELIVFNKWGNVIFRQKNYDNSWDGVNMSSNRFENGKRVPPASYFYIFYAKDKVEKSGFIEIFY